jgi:hypothetical protein
MLCNRTSVKLQSHLATSGRLSAIMELTEAYHVCQMSQELRISDDTLTAWALRDIAKVAQAGVAVKFMFDGRVYLVSSRPMHRAAETVTHHTFGFTIPKKTLCYTYFSMGKKTSCGTLCLGPVRTECASCRSLKDS